MGLSHPQAPDVRPATRLALTAPSASGARETCDGLGEAGQDRQKGEFWSGTGATIFMSLVSS